LVGACGETPGDQAGDTVHKLTVHKPIADTGQAQHGATDHGATEHGATDHSATDHSDAIAQPDGDHHPHADPDADHRDTIDQSDTQCIGAVTGRVTGFGERL
jgi:hypothetical protein